MSLLKISGTKIVDEQGNEIVLRGAGLGGWMKSVNSLFFFFQSKCLPIYSPAWRTSSQVDHNARCRGMVADPHIGYPGCEYQIREALAETIGEEKSEFFFDRVCFPFGSAFWSFIYAHYSSSNISSKTRMQRSSRASD